MTIEEHCIQPGWSLAELAPRANIDVNTLKRAIAGETIFNHMAGALSKQNVSGVAASLTSALQQETQALFRSSIVLNPTCSTTPTSSLMVGQEGKSVLLIVITICTAISYSEPSAKNLIGTERKHW